MTLLASERSMLIRSKFRSVLQLRMQHRRTQEELNERNLLSPLNKVPPTASEQLINLGQGRTDDFLKFKEQNRPHKVGPAKMHFCNAGPGDCSELKEKKARLAEDLNEKILHRPGPLELVKKNILPLDSSIKDAMKEQIQLPSASDAFAFDEDISSSASSTSSSPRFAPSPGMAVNQSPTSTATVFQLDLPQILEENPPRAVSVAEAGSLATSGPTSTLPTQAAPLLPKVAAKPLEMGKCPRPKKPKDTKPKVKKLKYHQYIPPDQKVDKSPVAMDAAYSRLLQQQQIFLQLQILNQQQQQTFCVQAVHPLTTSISPDQVISFTGTGPTGASSISLSPPATPAATTTNTTASTMLSVTNTASSPSPKPDLLPANLDDLTVSKLRQQLRKRGLPVSGTKPALLERLKPYQNLCVKPSPMPVANASLLSPVLKLPTFHAPAGMGTNSPTLCTFRTAASPVAGDMPKAATELPSGTADSCDGSRMAVSGTVCPKMEEEVPMLEFDEDQVLQAKQKVIENLTWKLRQEQKQAEDLRVELEMHKRLKNRHKGELLAPGPAFASVLGRPSSSSPDSHSSASEAQFLYTLSNSVDEERTSLQEASNVINASDNFMLFCSPACDIIEQDFELPMQITASPESPVPGTLSLEEELQEAIQKAEMAVSQSIEDILEEPLQCAGELMSTDNVVSHHPKIKEEPQEEPTPCSQQHMSSSKRPRCSNEYLPAPAPPPTLMEFPISSHYDVLSTQDSLAMVFSPYQIEMPPSPDHQQSRASHSSSSSSSSTSKAPFDPADWLEALTSGSASGFGPSSPVGTSIFSTDFFDSPDLSVNRMIDLMVEQWKPDFDVLCA